MGVESTRIYWRGSGRLLGVELSPREASSDLGSGFLSSFGGSAPTGPKQRVATFLNKNAEEDSAYKYREVTHVVSVTVPRNPLRLVQRLLLSRSDRGFASRMSSARHLKDAARFLVSVEHIHPWHPIDPLEFERIRYPVVSGGLQEVSVALWL